MFKGFNIQLPNYTVLTPQTGKSWNVRSLNVSETNAIKSSLVTPSSAHKLINKVLWDAIVDKPAGMTNESFKKSITTYDREALLYGLYYVTYGDIRDFNATCVSCGKEQPVMIKLDHAFSMNPYPGSEGLKNTYKTSAALGTISQEERNPEIERAIAEDNIKKQREELAEKMQSSDEEDDGLNTLPPKEESKKDAQKTPVTNNDIVPETASSPTEEKPKEPETILTKRIPVVLPVSGLTVIVRQPTVWDEENLLSSIPFSVRQENDLVSETLIIERMVQKDSSGQIVEEATDREDILNGYQSISPQDKKTVFDIYEETFGQYRINLESKYECSGCGFVNTIDLNIAMQLFRMVNS